MALRWKVVRDETAKMEKAARALHGQRAEVGVKGEHAFLARLHEYGCQIPVSDKMRAFFAARFGVQLKKTTRVIVIPERPFLRGGHDACIGTVLDEAEAGLPAALLGKTAPKALVAKAAKQLCQGIKAHAKSGNFAKNSPLTVKNKGHAQPLTDSGAMLNGLDYEVKKG